MSLNSAALIAFSGLSAAQVQISIVSSNISNADTTGYTEEIADQLGCARRTVARQLALIRRILAADSR